MQEGNQPQDAWRSVVFFLIGLCVVWADQLSKWWIKTALLRGQSLFELGFFRITHTRNTGAAFGLFQDHTFVLAIVSAVGAIVILFCAFFLPRYLPFLGSMLGRVSLGLVFGGTIGNLIDRFFFGSVTDFIDFSFWPAFNIADAAVTIGAIILAYSIFRSTQVAKR